jgi:hypothetical protein
MVIAAAIGGFFLVVLPLVVFTILLFRHRHSLADPVLSSWLGYLYTSYRPKEDTMASNPRAVMCFYSEVLYMVFRFALAASLSIPNNQSPWKPIINAMLLIAILPVFLGFKPYTRPIDNHAAFTCIIVLIITLFVTVQIDNKAAVEDVTIFEVLILAINGLTVVMFFVLIVWCGRGELQRNVNNIKEWVNHYYTRAQQYKNRITSATPEPYLNVNVNVLDKE